MPETPLEKTTLHKQFIIVRLRDCDEFNDSQWDGVPGFARNRDGLILQYGITEVAGVGRESGRVLGVSREESE